MGSSGNYDHVLRGEICSKRNLQGLPDADLAVEEENIGQRAEGEREQHEDGNQAPVPDSPLGV